MSLSDVAAAADGMPVEAPEAAENWPLDPQQRAVVEEPVDAKVLVVAGPGTGKTHTLVARVARIARLLQPGEEVLVLTFTRSVVTELCSRLANSGNDAAAYVRPMTFDSFASRLLYSVPEAFETRDQYGASYDGRIRAASAACANLPDVAEWLSTYRHVIVDEIQDLEAPRSTFVLRLLELVRAFTVFGDPAQGIYGFSRDLRDEVAVDVSEVLEQHPDVRRHELTRNYRALTATAETATSLRSFLIRRADAATAYPALANEVASLEPVGDLQDAVPIVRTARGTVGILTRNNAEAAMVSEALWQAGVDHILRRPSTEQPVAPWLGQVARGRSRSLKRTAFDAAFADCVDTPCNADEAWEALTDISGDDRRVDLSRIADHVRRRSVPDVMTCRNTSRIVVSTIHRAKGLEFDHVFLVQCDARRDQDDAEEARVLFVALTRPRRELALIEPLDCWWSQDQRIERWVKCIPGKPKSTIGYEVRDGDVHHMHPAGTFLFRCDPVLAQTYIQDHIRRGDAGSLEVRPGDEDGPRYFDVMHSGVRVGVTNDAFAMDLSRRTFYGRMPRRITNLRFEESDTVAGLESIGSEAGLGNHGLWLRPRLSGLGRVEWK